MIYLKISLLGIVALWGLFRQIVFHKAQFRKEILVSSNSSKKRNKDSDIVLLGKKTNSFVRFLEESLA